jgi:hypothetical protein
MKINFLVLDSAGFRPQILDEAEKFCQVYLAKKFFITTAKMAMVYPLFIYNKTNGTAHFKKCKQLFQYQHLEASGGQSSYLYLNVLHIFTTSVN